MEVRQRTNGVEKQYVPTTLQKAIGEPLRSEQRTGEILPRVLTQGNLLVIFITVVLFILNVSLVQPTGAAGSTVSFYWIFRPMTFLVPATILRAQLNGLIAQTGGIYGWTARPV